MKLFEDMRIKFEQADWSRNPEFGLLDTILSEHPELLAIVEGDVRKGCKISDFGRKDMPSVEQITRRDGVMRVVKPPAASDAASLFDGRNQGGQRGNET